MRGRRRCRFRGGGWLAATGALHARSIRFSLLLWIVGGACAIGAAWQAKFHRLAALIMVGGAGLVVCLTFAWLSAPDLALTQIAVEVVTMVLFLLGLRWLPRRLETRYAAAAQRECTGAAGARRVARGSGRLGMGTPRVRRSSRCRRPVCSRRSSSITRSIRRAAATS